MAKILIVDDQKSIRDLLFLFLTRNCQFECCLAENGERGLEIFKKETPDLIITDIEMPIMNGKEMIKKIRSFGSQIPVIFMSSLRENFEGLESAGNCDFIEKIPSLKEFSRKIEKLLA